MKKTLGRLAVVTTVAGGVVAGALLSGTVATAQSNKYTPKFTKDRQLIRPTGWREWIYVGTPLTPNKLNDGNAPFPEFHSVYIDPVSWAQWKRTGKFREGTMIAKELSLVGDNAATSGMGFFMGRFNGLEITIKSKKLYPKDPGNWAYYTFGHKAPPYAKTAKKQAAEACNACHEASAKDDWVFTQYYPVLRAAKGKK